MNMFYIEREHIERLIKKINKGREKLNTIQDKFGKFDQEEEIDQLRTSYQEELERNKQIWEDYKNSLGKQSKQLFDLIEQENGIRMIPSFDTYLKNQFDQEKQPRTSVNTFNDYVLEWEDVKEKEIVASSFHYHDIFSYLTKKDHRFGLFLHSKVEVENHFGSAYEGDYESPSHIYRKNMFLTITDFDIQEHSILHHARSIRLALEGSYYNGYGDEREHVLPYRLYEEVKENGLNVTIDITLNNGSVLKVDQLSALFDEWEHWANAETQNEAFYKEAWKEWYLLSAWTDYQNAQTTYYEHSGLNRLEELLQQKETKNYLLQYPYNGHVILSVHPVLGQIITNLHFDESLSFLEPRYDIKDVENLLYMLSLFNEKHLEVFPSEEQQVQLLEEFIGLPVLSEEDKVWVGYKKDIISQYGVLKEANVKEAFDDIIKTTGKNPTQLLKENNEQFIAFLLKLAVLLESNGQSGNGFITDDEYEELLQASLLYINHEQTKTIIQLALTRYRKSLTNRGIFKLF